METLASDIIDMLKKQNKRQFIIIIVILILWFLTIGGFIYYIKTTGYEVVTESTEVENENGNANACIGDNCNNGVINGQSESN